MALWPAQERTDRDMGTPLRQAKGRLSLPAKGLHASAQPSLFLNILPEVGVLRLRGCGSLIDSGLRGGQRSRSATGGCFMLTGIGRMEMRVRDLDACRAFYRDAMGLTEWGAPGGRGGGRSATFVVGESVLECIEDPDAVVGRLPTGEERDWADVPGSVNHLALYVDDIYTAYDQLKGKAEPRTLKDGPEAMPLGHTYLQRVAVGLRRPERLRGTDCRGDRAR